MFQTNFLTRERAERLANEHGTPLFVYSRRHLQGQAAMALEIDAPFGLTVRFAMKANPHQDVLYALRDAGIKIDASSGYEAEHAMACGFAPEDILLTSQQLAPNLAELAAKGVQFNATSLRQLEAYGQTCPGTDVSVRVNPGIGSGHSAKTNVGGSSSSFGIWHEYIPQIKEIADKYQLRIIRMHTHIGSGTDPAVWHDAARVSLALIKNFPEATSIDLGDGFKVGRMDGEQSIDLAAVGEMISAELREFQAETGRELKLEIEPGTFLVANAGILLARVDDVTDTGEDGYNFIKLDAGMTEILRPSLYGAQHPIAILNDATELRDYVVVGHCCESGDLLTPAYGEPETLAPRRLPLTEPGDLCLIGGTGAYCAGMAARGYNGFPIAAEIMID